MFNLISKEFFFLKLIGNERKTYNSCQMYNVRSIMNFSDDGHVNAGSNYRLIFKQTQCTRIVMVIKYDKCLYHTLFLLLFVVQNF